MGRAARTAGALVVAAGALAGCSEAEPASATLPTTSAQAAPTSEALPPLGPADFPMPPEARTQDGPGAEAFTRYYIGLINRTSTIMDAVPLREFSSNCRDCDRIATFVDDYAARGYRYQGGILTITWMGSAFEPGDTVEVGFVADQTELQVVDGSGNAIPELSSRAYPGLNSGIAASWDDERNTWVVTSLTLG
ncbi:hypothetical protein SAMN05660657_00243 [Geodermatophilus amargosae]|uniref:Lipoprotein n=2 Tax=Geodermatophilus amargosae TaxID=1296565 RepID=A0A1I6X7V3_9ACTN|nr:hypothetical protein SAMN05660657_00243 [Geodermatophilus amargosae]